ncbi:MAG: transglycosylase domain-containing protein [Minisyncoccota bacterium]
MRFLAKKRHLPNNSKMRPRFWKILMWTILIGIIILFFLLVGAFAYIAKDLPNPSTINKRALIESTKIYDRTGTHLLYEVHGEEKRTVIPFSDMPDVVKYATISLEDQDFYHHFGIKISSIVRSILKDLITFDRAQGGSTITQQFVKNSLLTNEKTLIRKVKEVILSLEMETKFSKDEILAMYLNEIPYGSNAYGIEAASQTFFGKPARELTLDEAALISSLPQATAYYSPYGSHTDALIGRQAFTLKTMARLGYITQEQAESAINTDTLAKIQPQKDIIAAPHFVMYIKDYLQQKYGDRAVEESGYKVITTLDWDKQQIAEQVVQEGAEKNIKWKASNAALVAMDPKTGQILSMVGSKNYFNNTIDGQVNVAIRDRQPGSSFKPYVYLTAFTKGYLPETILYDTKTQFETAEGKSYEPNNYDGKFHGPLPMMKTLGGSLNVPAVKTLYLVGVKDAIQMAKNLGITGLNDPSKLGLSLVLGGGEVKLLDHAHAYSTIANNGIKHPMTAILRIEDAKGVSLEEFTLGNGERVVEEKYIAMLDSILSNNENRAWVFGDNSPLRFDNRPVSAKTGTTNEFRDGWTIGYTPSLVTVVWAGNNDNSPMVEGADGINVAAPIWRAFMDKTLSNYAIEEFPKYNPEDEIGDEEGKTNKPLLAGKIEQEENIRVCQIPDKKDVYCLANKYCRDKDTDKKTFISDHDILYYINREDPRGPLPEKPENDPQYKNWEKGVQNWYEKQKGVVLGEPPKDECRQSDFDNFEPKVSLSLPESVNGNSLNLRANIDAPYGIKEITYSVDGSKIGSSSSKSYSPSYSIPDDKKNHNTLTVEVEVIDKNGNKATDKKDVKVDY